MKILATLGFALAMALALPAAALDGIALSGPEADRGPTAEEKADALRAEREALEKRVADMNEREDALRVQAKAEAEAERTACPRLTQIKYPWISCTTNRWGGKELTVPGTAPSEGVRAMFEPRDEG